MAGTILARSLRRPASSLISPKITLCCFLVYLRCFPSLPHSFALRGFSRVDRHFSAMAYRPITIGLTGSIGMGKSTITQQLGRLGIPVFDADKAVHDLYARGGDGVDPIRRLFPEAIVDDSIERTRLSKIVMSDPSALQRIEAIIHPLVASKRQAFYQHAVERNDLFIAYDIPLLFENRKMQDVDYVVVVTASPETQRRRVLERGNMSEEKFQTILSKQTPDEEKRRLANYVICTDYEGFVEGRAQLAKVLQDILVKDIDRFEAWKRRSTSPPISLHSSTAAASPVDAVVFDLDDTLVANQGPMKHAYEQMKAFMEEYLPQTQAALRTMHLPSLMQQCKQDHPLIGHDLTELRQRVLQRVAATFGETHRIPQAMEVFLRARSDLEAHCFPDSLPCLAYLRERGLSCHILTNGNAQETILHRHVDHFLTASEVGAAKPSPIGFLALAMRLGLPPHRMVYIGDSYAHDIVGAKAVGLKTILLLRQGEAREETDNAVDVPCADAVITDLSPSHLEAAFAKIARGDISDRD